LRLLPAQRDGLQLGLARMKAMRISAPWVKRGEALPARKDHLTIVAIGTCLVLALMSFGIVAIS
jgi:hypothetical protein